MNTKIDLTVAEQIFGSTTYSVSVSIANIGGTELTGIEVEPLVLSGRLLRSQVEMEETQETELENRHRNLIEEMERQVAKAYERQYLNGLSSIEKIFYIYIKVIDAYAGLFSRRKTFEIPIWTQEAFRIHDWNDVEMLESELIANEKEDSTLRKAFMIDKAKLRRCLDGLAQKDAEPATFEAGTSLSHSASVTFPFTIRAPHLLRRRITDLQFKVSYRDVGTGKLTTESLTKRVVIRPSAFAVPTGGMVGAICGYGIKATLESAPVSNWQINWATLGGSVLLGLLVALFVSRKPDTYKVITVEDFLGGFIIGALTGMFSESVFERLRSIFVRNSG